jgi:hypothetical protein
MRGRGVSEHVLERERAAELLADLATVGLSDEEHEELQRLLAKFPDLERNGYDFAAAAAHLAYGPEDGEPLPPVIRARLLNRAPFASAPGCSVQSEIISSADEYPLMLPEQRSATAAVLRTENTIKLQSGGESFGVRWTHMAGWMAAAACLALALLGWWPEIAGARRAGISPAERHAQLRTLDPQAVSLDWTVVDPLAHGASGDIVFSLARQQGSARVRGLSVNDPERNVYQMWIFDGRREGPPVDAGTFDVKSEAGDLYLTVRPRLHTTFPVTFAITLERAGGVVVSKQDRLLLVAQVGKSR